MKGGLRIGLLACAALTVTLALAACGRENEKTIVLGDGLQANGISVGATGEVSVTPDTATVTLGVFTQKSRAKEAQRENAQVMERVMGAVTGAGVQQEDIKTIQYSVNPAYSYEQTKISRYDVNNVLQFEMSDVNKVGEVLDAAADAGANTGFSVSFSLKDDAKPYQQALDMAVKNARAKAEKIAASAGRGVASARSITESKSSSTVYEAYPTSDKAASSQIPVSAGTLKVQATVDIVYDWQ